MKETLELLTAIFHIKLAYQEAMADDKIDWTDTTKFIPVIKPIITAIKGIDKIPTELLDIDQEGLEELAHSLGIMFELDKLETEEVKEALEVLNVLKGFIIKKV